MWTKILLAALVLTFGFWISDIRKKEQERRELVEKNESLETSLLLVSRDKWYVVDSNTVSFEKEAISGTGRITVNVDGVLRAKKGEIVEFRAGYARNETDQVWRRDGVVMGGLLSYRSIR